ncbi:N-acetylgalactosamine kinase isoform X2 [Chiloscyllium punctatum]|uniref:N-acetylgalactosamine kinase isoform X2 n=1 Tax=Chiloscyllium punctatum TaxID=137246 RepID=UPI003B633C4D
MVDKATPPQEPVLVADSERFTKLKDAFISKYGAPPAFYARAPGRVNLIGEHIDYCGYAVLPMALEQDILAAVTPTQTNLIQLANTNPVYLDYHVHISEIHIETAKPQWHHYFLCGFKGIQVEIAEICAKCERYIGTEGGGMDQSISFLAEKGMAKLIEFNPLRATNVKLPKGAVFVIANSCIEMNKAATAHYNIRVVECRLATKILAKGKGVKWENLLKLGDLQTELGVSLETMISNVEQILHPEPYSREEVCQHLGISQEELCSTILSQNTQHVTTFKLYQRAKHVYTEARRVLQFKRICDEAPANALQLLGELMNQSHTSCRDMYECSCPELDQLVDICIQSGAIGSRLTGAGWGGCTVSMVPTNNLNSFLMKVQEVYYKADVQRAALHTHSLFATQPAGGAAAYYEA